MKWTIPHPPYKEEKFRGTVIDARTRFIKIRTDTGKIIDGYVSSNLLKRIKEGDRVIVIGRARYNPLGKLLSFQIQSVRKV